MTLKEKVMEIETPEDDFDPVADCCPADYPALAHIPNDESLCQIPNLGGCAACWNRMYVEP